MDILAFLGHMAAMQAHLEHDHKDALEAAGALVEDAAKEAIGTYHFGWPALSPETVARKANGDTPLLETGEMRDSIQHKLSGPDSVDVGSDNMKAVYHELGTSKAPPRSFLAAAAMEQEAEVVKLLSSPLSSAPMIGRKT